MTDVALRDRVKLTLGESTVVGTVSYLYRGPSTFIDIVIDGGEQHANSFDLSRWTLTKLPKPLATEPGMYVDSGFDDLYAADIYELNTEYGWTIRPYFYGGETKHIEPEDVPTALVRLVKES